MFYSFGKSQSFNVAFKTRYMVADIPVDWVSEGRGQIAEVKIES